MKHSVLPIFLKCIAIISCQTSPTSNVRASDNDFESFSIASKDGQVSLEGQINFPKGFKGETFPLVVMVPGTGLFDRDVEFGRSSTDKDLVFKVLGNAILSRGIATLRYDYRGVSCNSRTVAPCTECQSSSERRSHFISKCIDNEIRKNVTPENIRDDIESVYLNAKNHSKVDPNRIVVFGHSEGSVNLSYLIKQKRISPKGAIFMGGLAESLANIIEWQMTDRMINGIMAMDKNEDYIVTNDEISMSHAESYLKAFPLESLLSPDGQWSREQLEVFYNERYEQTKNDALAKDDSEPFGSGEIVQASYRWWKMFFIDKQAIVDNFSEFRGPVIFHNGDSDIQTDFARQKRKIEEARKDHGINISLVPHIGLGHSLGKDPIMGPISDDSRSRLVDSIETILER